MQEVVTVFAVRTATGKFRGTPKPALIRKSGAQAPYRRVENAWKRRVGRWTVSS